jgi:hypothetical protein
VVEGILPNANRNLERLENFRNLCGCEHLDVLDIADLLAGVDVDKEGHIGPSPNPEKFAVSFE